MRNAKGILESIIHGTCKEYETNGTSLLMTKSSGVRNSTTPPYLCYWAFKISYCKKAADVFFIKFFTSIFPY